MAQQPEKHEVGVVLAEHHGFEIKLNVGLTREASIIAEYSEPQAIGDEAPKMFFGTVQRFL